MCTSHILQVNKNMKLPKQTHSQVIISTAVFELPDTPLTLGFTEKVDEPGTYQTWWNPTMNPMKFEELDRTKKNNRQIPAGRHINVDSWW